MQMLNHNVHKGLHKGHEGEKCNPNHFKIEKEILHSGCAYFQKPTLPHESFRVANHLLNNIIY